MKFQKSLLSVVIAGSVCAGDLAMAQTSGGGFALEEIVVTARKREENLQPHLRRLCAVIGPELIVADIYTGYRPVRFYRGHGPWRGTVY
jgi:hypothetical protein